MYSYGNGKLVQEMFVVEKIRNYSRQKLTINVKKYFMVYL